MSLRGIGDHSQEARQQVLRRTPIFSALDDNEIGELAKIAVERRFLSGEMIFLEGDSPGWFYVVSRGQVKALKHSSSGKEFIIAFFGPGEMFGEVAVFENKPYPATARAQAVIETRVLGVRREDFSRFLVAHPQLALRIVGVLGERLRIAQGRLGVMAGERVEQRLAGILLMLSTRLGKELPFTRQEIADMVGTTIETSIRITSHLKKKGIISSSRGRIVILDAARLRLLSEGLTLS